LTPRLSRQLDCHLPIGASFSFYYGYGPCLGGIYALNMTTVVGGPAAITEPVLLAHSIPDEGESVCQKAAEDGGATATKKKKKKKSRKPKPSPPVVPATSVGAMVDVKQSVLCISRNKHWRYISSYHVGLLSPLSQLSSTTFFV